MRPPETTKHDYGHALLIAGAYGRMGCAILAARAALRSGCGLVSVHLPSRCVDPMQAAFPEAMVSIDPCDKIFSLPPNQLERYSAIAIGPGIGTDETTQEALYTLLSERPADMPLVLDADALNILALHSDWLSQAKGAIITPHSREYERLFGDNAPAEMAKHYGLIIVKKAHHTRVYSPEGQVYENHTGNAGMATAGSGDVLTGIITGLLARGYKQDDACVVGMYLHGLAGDIAARELGEESVIASDLIQYLPQAFKKLRD